MIRLSSNTNICVKHSGKHDKT